ncbi:MAG: efflux RND transporter periplasmic adaptor subunit, partial [Desulfovibrionaceae bacterium]
DLRRYEGLRDKDYVSAQQLETQKALVRQYEGIVASNKAKVDDAALNLEYSRVTAPMSGRLGLRQVDAGNMIHASDSEGIVRITRMEPAYVVFTLPESQLPLLLTAFRGPDAQVLTVEVWDREYKKPLASGVLLTIDNQIDTTTGTIKLKAEFANTDGQLFPNQFVNAQLLIRTLSDALVVPSSAIQRGPKGSFVYVVQGNKALVRPVQTGWTNNTHTVIDSGLHAGEVLVIDGLDRLRDGMPVSVAHAETAPSPATTPTSPKR